MIFTPLFVLKTDEFQETKWRE